jgi:hypothetical protein
MKEHGFTARGKLAVLNSHRLAGLLKSPWIGSFEIARL